MPHIYSKTQLKIWVVSGFELNLFTKSHVSAENYRCQMCFYLQECFIDRESDCIFNDLQPS